MPVLMLQPFTAAAKSSKRSPRSLAGRCRLTTYSTDNTDIVRCSSLVVRRCHFGGAVVEPAEFLSCKQRREHRLRRIGLAPRDSLTASERSESHPVQSRVRRVSLIA